MQSSAYFGFAACATCGRLSYALAELRDSEKRGAALDPRRREHLLDEQRAHLDKARSLRNHWKELVARVEAKRVLMAGKRTSICKIEDNMSTLLLPSARSLFQQRSRSYSDFLQCHMGGIQSKLSPEKSKTTYFPFSEAVANENTNTILTQLSMDLREDLNEFRDLDTLYLLLDRHTTGWNKMVVSFYQMVVDLGILSTVVMLTFDPGHHINDLDHTNSLTSRAYVTESKRTFAGIVDMDSAIQVLSKASPTFRIVPLFCVLDFKSAFSNFQFDVGTHMTAHILEITAAGIRSKQHPREEWNIWRGNGATPQTYHRIFPRDSVLPVVTVAANAQLDIDHLAEVKKVVTAAHLENLPFWASIFSGGVGGAPNVEPFDIALLPRRHGVPAIPLPGEETRPNNSVPLQGFVISDVLGEEIGTTSVSAHRPVDGSYQFKVHFTDGTKQWQDLDDLVDVDYTINLSLQQYLAQHPQVKNKGASLEC